MEAKSIDDGGEEEKLTVERLDSKDVDTKADMGAQSPSSLNRDDYKVESGSPSRDVEDQNGPRSPSSPSKDMKDIVDKVMHFATSSDFEYAFERFAEENQKAFVPMMFSMGPEDEHPLAWHEVYLDYLHTFEGKIERFIESNGYKINDFYDQAREILEDDEVFGEARFFLEALLATSEYEYFVFLIKSEMQKYKPNDVDAITPVNVDDIAGEKTESKEEDDTK